MQNLDPDEIIQTMESLRVALQHCGISYHLTGGFAAIFYGEPRFTQDIDIVVNLSSDNQSAIIALVECLAPNFLIDRDIVRDAVKRRSLFQALHQETFIKVDFHIGEMIEGQFQRASVKELLPGVAVSLISRQDAILSKLIWAEKGSGKSRQDLTSMLRLATPEELCFIQNESKNKGIEKLLEQILEEINGQDSGR